LASTLPAGQISYLVYAAKLMMSPLLVITATGGLLAFVAMSHASARGEQEVFQASFVRSARVLIILLAMATLALLILRRPIVELALQHGRFTVHDTDITATLLAIYALGLLPNGISWLLLRSLQSRGRYWQAVQIALVVAGIYVGSVVLLFHLWGLFGIAAAFPVSQSASVVVLSVRQPDYLQLSAAIEPRFARSIALLCVAISILLAALQIGSETLRFGVTGDALLSLIGGVAIVLGGLLFGLQLLRVPEGKLFRAWVGMATRRAVPPGHDVQPALRKSGS
jgi:putative peptidoglycan lipid II flippase